MPRKGRPPTSGYARIAQAEEEEDSHDESEENFHQGSLSNSQYAPIQPKRNSRMGMPSRSGDASPETRRGQPGRRGRANSGVDIKAINARLERWAEEIAQKFKIKKNKDRPDEEVLEIHHSVFQAPDGMRPATAETLTFDFEDTADRITKLQFDDAVEGVRLAIEMGTHPLLISQGSSGSYFARNTQGKIVGVFKPKDEEPYASKNPKWTKWIHRNLFPFGFGRACLIPNLSYISEAAAYVLDTQLRTNIVPYTDIVSFSSKSFHYDFWDRRAYYRKKKPFPEKIGSFQIFLKGFKDANIFLKEHPWPDQHNVGSRETQRRKKRRWAEECRPSGAQSDNEYEDESRPNTADVEQHRKVFWTAGLQQSFREQLEKLVILDYIMRNTDRGLDNWMIRIDQKTQKATIVAEPPQMDEVDSDDGPSEYTKHSMPADPYRRQEPMSATSRSATPMPNAASPSVSLGAIDNSLSWPWKHPDAVSHPFLKSLSYTNYLQWRSYPFGWLFLPVSLIGQPFSEATRNHFLPLLTSKQWWSDTQAALRKCFTQDADFKERMYAKQIAVMKGQAWNVVETLKTPDHGPLELTRRARVCVWDDLVEIPIVVPLRAPSAEMRRKQQQRERQRPGARDEEMDITALSTPPQKPVSDLVMNSPPLELAKENRFNLSRESSSMDVHDRQENMRGPLSPATVQSVPWSARAITDPPSLAGHTNGRPSHRPRMSYEETQRRGEGDHRRHHRRYSLTAARRGREVMFEGDEDEGDLGYAANEDLEGNRKMVIVERLEMVKGKNPVFSWC
jgi:phosphatidylinositol 4-kinase type 2